MAQVILGGLGGAIGGTLGATIGGLLGRSLDQGLVAGLTPARQRGPRLEGLKVQGTAEGAPMACVFGRARVTGQVIWAARFQENRRTSSASKGGPRTVEYGYSLSFAVALCEGEIDGVGRVWADGQPLDLTRVTMRVYRGGPDQSPDSLIEAIEGQAPAFRGTAYAVFEDLPLGAFGNRVPQLSFEVFRRARGAGPRLEDRLEGVCLIPGAGEFVLATEPVLRREGLTRSLAENVHAGDGRADLAVSLDQLQVLCPNLKRVSLVVGWFGDDIRAGHCRIRPGIERVEKTTEPLTWSVAGLARHEAHEISRIDGQPAYGGTPSDDAVRQAILELKRRGLEVTLYPFVFMDIPSGNGLPDPAGGGEQPAHPWRGRIRGRDGEHAASDITSLFGETQGWGLRRMVLHYAALAFEAGADGLLIGSEMRGVTFTRDEAGGFPAVDAFRALAAECRAVTGSGFKLSYAADWSEYAGPRSGGEAVFHLDPLWADPAIDYVGIDWYPPLGDWRDGEGGLDAAAFDGPDDPAYLESQVAGGEGFDWYYATEVDRSAQTRTPIHDHAHGEHWVFRAKDVAGWWSNLHHDRVGGVRSPEPTPWVPGMKPVRLTEFGCAAVDRGGNAPNLFQDPKSTESARPPYSTGGRDDRTQRRALEALLSWFAENNPISPIYGAPMLEAADAWCWDARPWPAFPARVDLWADAGAWRTGHWLNGRLGGESRDIIAAVLEWGGVTDFDIGGFSGEVAGYVIDRPMRTRDALEPLLAALGLTAAERGGRVAVVGEREPGHALATVEAALPESGEALTSERVLEARPVAARVRFINGDADYQTGSALARQGGEGGSLDLDLPAVCTSALAETAAERALAVANGERLTVRLAPLQALRADPGDRVNVDDRGGDWRIIRIERDEAPSATLERVAVIAEREAGEAAAPEPARPIGTPLFRMLDLPLLPSREDDPRPVVVLAADPWRPMRVWAGASADVLTARADIPAPSTVGSLTAALGLGPRYRWDEINALEVRIEGLPPASCETAGVLAGANLVAVETTLGWELVQFRTAMLIGPDLWRLSGLLRGQQGTLAGAAEAGALVVFLESDPPRANSSSTERGLPLLWRGGLADRPPGALAGELVWTRSGLADRPWSPVHLRARPREDGGLNLDWIARTRIAGDRWDGDVLPSDPMRFRVRILDGEAEVRRIEAEATSTVYEPDHLAADFPVGFGDGVFAVSQWSDGYGWGLEAVAALN